MGNPQVHTAKRSVHDRWHQNNSRVISYAKYWDEREISQIQILKCTGNLAQCCGQLEMTWSTVQTCLDESGGEEPCGMHSQNKSCRWSRCQSMQQCFTPEMRVWCTKCRESSFGWMEGGYAGSTVIHNVRTWWVHDAGWSWWRLGRVHTDKSVCAWMCAMTCWGKNTSWNCMGMAQRVLWSTVAMQVSTRHHYKSRRNPWK